MMLQQINHNLLPRCGHLPPGNQLLPRLNKRFTACLDPYVIYVDTWVDKQSWSCECGHQWIGKNISWKLVLS